jgi:hypothetical protein
MYTPKYHRRQACFVGGMNGRGPSSLSILFIIPSHEAEVYPFPSVAERKCFLPRYRPPHAEALTNITTTTPTLLHSPLASWSLACGLYHVRLYNSPLPTLERTLLSQVSVHFSSFLTLRWYTRSPHPSTDSGRYDGASFKLDKVWWQDFFDASQRTCPHVLSRFIGPSNTVSVYMLSYVLHFVQVGIREFAMKVRLSSRAGLSAVAILLSSPLTAAQSDTAIAANLEHYWS